MDIFAALESLPPIQLLKTSFYVYPTVSATHILSIGTVLTTVGIMDLAALGAFRRSFDAAALAMLRRLALWGFVGAALSGTLLFCVRAGDYGASWLFAAKMALILLAGVNALVFSVVGARVARGDLLARASAAVSLLVWTGVLLCGRFLGFL